MNGHKLMKFGPLPIRILVGIALILHGMPKLSDIAGAQSFFGKMGLPPELAVIIALLEVIDGFAILFGILTRVAAGLFIIEMIGTTLTAKLSKGFIGGFELDLLIMAICISLFLTGPGRMSIEYDILKMEIFPKGRKLINELRGNPSS